MIWAVPQALWLLLSLPLLAAIFLYRRRIPIVDVPAISPWLELSTPVDEHSWRSLFRRLLVLAIQVVIVLLLILAAASPTRRDNAEHAAVIVLDASATMQTLQADGKTRFEHARSICLDVLSRLAPDAQVRVVVAYDVPRVLDAFPDRMTTTQVIGQVVPADTDSNLLEAIRLAYSLNQDNQEPITVISDFADGGTDMVRQISKRSGKARLLVVGDDSPNAGITSAFVEEADNGHKALSITLGQHGMQNRQVSVLLQQAGKTIRRQAVAFDAGSITAKFDLPPDTASDQLEIQLDTHDALGLDNCYRVGQTAPIRTVTLITKGNAMLAAALLADGKTALDIISPDQFSAVRNSSLVVFDCALPVRAHPRQGTSYLFVGVEDPFGWSKRSGNGSVGNPTSWATGHPVLRDIRGSVIPPLSAIRVYWNAGIEGFSLIDCNGIPVVAEARTPSGEHGVYLLFDPFQTSLPPATFVLLIGNCVDYLSDVTGGVPSSPTRNYAAQRSTHPLPGNRQSDTLPSNANTLPRAIAGIARISTVGLVALAILLAVMEYALFHRGQLRIG